MVVEMDLISMMSKDLIEEFLKKIRLIERKNEHWHSREAEILKQEILRRLQPK